MTALSVTMGGMGVVASACGGGVGRPAGGHGPGGRHHGPAPVVGEQLLRIARSRRTALPRWWGWLRERPSGLRAWSSGAAAASRTTVLGLAAVGPVVCGIAAAGSVDFQALLPFALVAWGGLWFLLRRPAGRGLAGALMRTLVRTARRTRIHHMMNHAVEVEAPPGRARRARGAAGPERADPERQRRRACSARAAAASPP